MTPPTNAEGSAAVRVIVVMGVAGSGKTTVGRALAADLGWRFVDADDHHSPESIAKMARGEPLDDADRWPWLDRLRGIIEGALADGAGGLVLACSALKTSYRARLAGDDAGGRVRFVYLAGPPELFRDRLARRAGHYMKAAMLESQLATLEPPADAVAVDAGLPIAALVARARAALAI
jgi:gluconokinase